MKKTVSILLSIMMMLSVFAGIDFSAYALESSGVVLGAEYTYSNGTLTLVKSQTQYKVVPNLNAFANNSNIKKLVISSEFTYIEKDAFSSCDNLEEVEFGGANYELLDRAFLNCTSLKKVTFIEYSAIRLGDEVFSGCTSLESININKVFKVGEYAFRGCTSLKEAVFNEVQVDAFKEGAFNGCTALTYVDLGDAWKTSDFMFWDCTNLRTLKLSDRFKSFGTGTFMNCNSLSDIYYDDNKTYWEQNPQIAEYLASKQLNPVIHFIKESPISQYQYPADMENYISKMETIETSAEGIYDLNLYIDNLGSILGMYKYNLDYSYWRVYDPATPNKNIVNGDFCVEDDFASNKYSIFVPGVALDANKVYCLECIGIELDEVGERHIASATKTWNFIVVPSKNVSCTVDGYTTEYNSSTGKITKTPTTATGHNFTVEKSAQLNPTCTAAGKKAVMQCANCSATTGGETIPATGHKYTTTVSTTRATTSADGKIVKKCACGKTQTTTIKKVSTVKLSTTKYTYDGKVKSPTLTVKDSDGKALVKGTDYTVSVPKGRKAVGKYTYKITFKGNYSGTKSLSFTIVPKTTSISSLTAASKGFTVKWKKQATQTTGYQIQIATDSKFTKGVKNYTVSKNSTVSKKITKLTGKKKYYVRIRTYKTVSGTKYYSSWSAKKYVTTKK